MAVRSADAWRRAIDEGRSRLTRRRLLRNLAILALVAFAIVLLLFWVQALRAEPALDATPSSVTAPDADQDGIPDAVENVIGSDPHARRATHLLPEAWIRRYGFDITDPALENRTAPYPKADLAPRVYGADGLPPEYRMTLYEVYAFGRPASWNESTQGDFTSGLDPRSAFVNGSDVPYSWLIHFGLDPKDPSILDTPLPGMPWSPREAYHQGLSPRSLDEDHDGLPDADELRLGTSPRLASTAGTGIPDGWLFEHGFNLTNPAVAFEDTDHDGLDNLAEFQASERLVGLNATLAGGGLDPRKPSSAGSPIPDGWFVRFGLDPLKPGLADQVTEEATFDGPSGNHSYSLRAIDEYRANRPPSWNESANGPWLGGSDPTKNDTDGDGIRDVEEIVGYLVPTPTGSRRVSSDPTRLDSDNDGLSDAEERAGRRGDLVFPPTDPSTPDTDGDGLEDGQELGVRAWHGIVLPRLDPTSKDTDRDGLPDGREAEYWLGRSTEAADASVPYAWGPPTGRPTLVQALAHDNLSVERVAAALAPGGDLDGDGIPNILDPDADGDGLLDGWEVEPENYLSSPFASATRRPATDPANVDTDLDGLPDRWEVTYGLFDAKLGGWNLDPSRWSSFGDDKSDADHDLDADGIQWYSYHVEGGRTTATAHTFVATNRKEFEAHTDPNKKSSSPDGINDAWKIFWGSVYLGLAPEDLGDIYPGAPGSLALPPDRPPPRPGNDDDITWHTVEWLRVVPAADVDRAACEITFPVRDSSGRQSDYCRVHERAAWGPKAAAGNATNPYLDDTDGDGAPDDWESAWAPFGGKLRMSPVLPDATSDLDGDGLDGVEEWEAGSNPFLADSDHGGADDRAEFRLRLDPNDPRDDVRALDNAVDSDHDKLSDARELAGFVDASGQRRSTDPLDPDTDHDGLLDGPALSEIVGHPLHMGVPEDAKAVRDLEARGLVVINYTGDEVDIPGEVTENSDPTRLSTSGDGVPDGWAFRYWDDPHTPTGLGSLYAYGRPSWWDESQHGIWRWGATPTRAPTSDMDKDGLNDLNGEDPIPFANPSNTLPRGDPREPGINATERLLRAQAYGGPGVTMPPDERVQTKVLLDPLANQTATNGTAFFSGNVTTLDGVGVSNATVVLSSRTRDLVLGVAITQPNGSFRGAITLAPLVQAPKGSAGVSVFGDATGAGAHENAAKDLLLIDPLRAVDVFAWSYNASLAPAPRQAGPTGHGFLGNVSDPVRTNLTLDTTLTLDAPASATAGARVPVTATLRASTGAPIPGFRVTIQPANVTLVTDKNGTVALDVATPAIPQAFVVSARSQDNLTFASSSAETSVKLLRTTTLLAQGPPGAVAANESFALRGALFDGDGEGVVGADLTIATPWSAIPARTLAGGRFAIEATVPANATPGDVAILVTHAGNDTLRNASARVTLRVAGAPHWETAPLSALRGEKVNVTATLRDAAGARLSGRSVQLAALGATLNATTNATGGASWTLDLARAPPGEHTLVLTYDDAIEGHAEAAVTLSIVARTSLNVSLAGDARGSPLAIDGTLALGPGEPLAGEALTLVVGDAATIKTRTDEAGHYHAQVMLDANVPTGPLLVAASYAGQASGGYSPANATARVDVVDVAQATADPRPILVWRPELSGEARTALGEPLADRPLLVEAPWGASAAVTDHDGKFLVNLTPPAGVARGDVSLRLVLTGDAALRGVDETFTAQLVDDGRLAIDAPPYATAGESVGVSYRLVDSGGADVAPSKVTLRWDDIVLPVTLRAGNFSFGAPAGAALGSHALRVDASAPGLLVAPRFANLTLRAPTRLAIEERPSATPGASSAFVVRLTSGGAGVANRTLLVQVGESLVRVETDAQGRAIVPIAQGGFREKTVDVAFVGDDAAAPVAIRAQVAVTPGAASAARGPWLPILAGVLLAAAIVIALVLRSRRAKNPLAQVARRLRSPGADFRELYAAYLALLRFAGLDEDAAEQLTFGEVVAKLGPRGLSDATLARLSEIFDQAIYAPGSLTPDAIQTAGALLDEVGRSVPVAGRRA